MSLKGDKFILLDELKEKEEESEENNGCQMVNGNTFLVSKESGKGIHRRTRTERMEGKKKGSV